MLRLLIRRLWSTQNLHPAAVGAAHGPDEGSISPAAAIWWTLSSSGTATTRCSSPVRLRSSSQAAKTSPHSSRSSPSAAHHAAHRGQLHRAATAHGQPRPPRGGRKGQRPEGVTWRLLRWSPELSLCSPPPRTGAPGLLQPRGTPTGQQVQANDARVPGVSWPKLTHRLLVTHSDGRLKMLIYITCLLAVYCGRCSLCCLYTVTRKNCQKNSQC